MKKNIIKLTILMFFILIVFNNSYIDILDNKIPLNNIIINEKDIIETDKIYIDYKDSNNGYIKAKTLNNNLKIKIQIIKNTTYNYDLSENLSVFTFSEGNGTYKINICENIKDNQYSIIYTKDININLINEFLPYLNSNKYVDFEKNQNLIDLTNKVTINSKNNYDITKDIFNYITTNISYDYEKANNVKTGYYPKLNEILLEKKGICFDYASLMSAMLRIKNIPCKLNVGYANNIYHAWINVYLEDMNQFNDDDFLKNENNWILMDPTFSVKQKKEDKKLLKLIKYKTYFCY